MKKTVWLIDIDGTVCEDIPNEEAHRFRKASVLPGALEKVTEFHKRGDRITFFTARGFEHQAATEAWLDENGFRGLYEKVVYEKPRINNGEEYHWVDNRSVFASCVPDGLR